MFIDENITKTKAFKEQLEQHAVLFAGQKDPSPRVRDRVFSRICQVLNATSGWLQSFISPDFKLHTPTSG